MAESQTWQGVVMGVFTILNAGVLVPLARSWRRNRNAGIKRDEAMGELGTRIESGMRELAGQVATMAATMGDIRGDVKVLNARVAVLERELERERDRSEGRRGRTSP